MIKFLLLRTRWGRQRAYKLLNEGYRRKRQRYDNTSQDVLPSTRAKRARELERIAAAIKKIEEQDKREADKP